MQGGTVYKITVDLPNLPHGEKVEVDGVGIFKNGDTYPLPDDFNMVAFLAHHNLSLKKQDAATFMATYGVDPDEVDDTPFDLVSAFDLTPGVTVEEYLSPSERGVRTKTYDEQTVEELKSQLVSRNEDREEKLSLDGRKQDLIDRLKEDDKQPVKEDES
jgi:hypothetical protein